MSIPDATRNVHDDGPDNAARARRLEWATLLKRVFALDVLTCPRCEGPMRLIAFIDDEHIARRILEHLGLPSRAPSAPAGLDWGHSILAGLSGLGHHCENETHDQECSRLSTH